MLLELLRGTICEPAEEQAHLDRAYVSLQRMRQRAEHMKDLGYLGGNVTEGGVETHDRQQWGARQTTAN